MTSKKSDSYLYTLLFHDILERIDILLLEARHLQINVIYSLKEPDFYLNLRYEERFIWCQGWENELKKLSDRFSELDCAKKYVPSYPRPERPIHYSSNSAEETGCRELDDINIRIVERVRESLYSGGWNNTQKNNYKVLYAAQQIKQSLVSDKLFVSRMAMNAGLDNSENKKIDCEDQKAKFLIVRAAVLVNIAESINRIRDLKSGFSGTIERNNHEHSKPIMERRRELGIYPDFLSERSQSILIDMCHLLGDKFVSAEDYSKTSEILHRWSHAFTSRNASSVDDILESYSSGEGKNEGVKYRSSILYINSNFWMPERPDLQPEIAHEVAHALLINKFDNLSELALKHGQDVFSTLFVSLNNSINKFDEMHGIPVEINKLSFLREISCDLLATSVKGMAYVYALFIEIIGKESEKLLSGFQGELVLEYIDSIDKTAPKLALKRQWFVRIKILLSWMKAVNHCQRSCALDDHLLEGAIRITINMERYMDTLLPKSLIVESWKWSMLANRLCDIVKTSDAAKITKKWRYLRSIDHKDQDEKKKGERIFQRSTARLPEEVRESLYKIQIYHKCAPGKPLYKKVKLKTDYKKLESLTEEDLEKVRDDFSDVYGVSFLPGSYSPLYRHLYDIPWQTAILRGIDLDLHYSNNEKKSFGRWLSEISNDMSLGRELFEYALEFHLWHSDAAVNRLDTVIALLEGYKQASESDVDLIEKPAMKRIYQWLGRSVGGTNSSYKEASALLENALKKHCSKYNFEDNGYANELRNLSAYELSSLMQFYPRISTAENRMLQRIIGYKLNDLLNLIEELFDGEGCIPLNIRKLMPIRKYLSTRLSSKFEPVARDVGGGTSGNLSKQDFYSRVNSSFSNTINQKVGSSYIKLAAKIDTYALNRGSITQAVGLPVKDWLGGNPADTVHYSHITDFCRDEEVKKTGSKVEVIEEYEEDKKPYIHIPILGPYDMLSLGKAKPLHHFSLPNLDKNCRLDKSYGENNHNLEKFCPFFIRTELARKISLHDVVEHKTRIGDWIIQGAILVALRKREFRLDFLYRILRAIEDEGEADSEINGLDYIGGRFNKGFDYALMTDGWGDLLLVFVGNRGERLVPQRIKDIFKIQNALFQDFMVDDTQTILTPLALDVAAKDKDNEFDIYVRAKLIEDRELRWSNDEFVSFIEREAREVPGFITQFSRTHGYMDYSLTFNFKLLPAASFSEYLKKIMSADYVSFYETCIGLSKVLISPKSPGNRVKDNAPVNPSAPSAEAVS